MTQHAFGGRWTALKLETVGKYLGAYNTALSKTPFRRIYADAFAGTGDYSPGTSPHADMLPREETKGSARIALEADFHEYYFNDLDPEHAKALRELQAQHPSKRIHVSQMDGNQFISNFCARLGRFDRAVLFVDPYSTELKWDSIQEIQRHPGIDLWLLFPISALSRMTPRKGSIPEWEAKITSMLGTPDWKREIYTESMTATADLFGEESAEITVERLDMRGLQGYITSLLRNQFPFASEPLELRNSKAPLFLLYFAITNPEKRAMDLARGIVTSILRKAGQR